MCELTTALAIAGTVASAAGSIYQGQQQAAASEFNASVARQNAQISQQRADAEADRHRRQIARLMGAQSTAFAASGVTGAGSPVEVLADTAAEGALDERLIRYGGALDARAFETEARMEEFQARQARIGGFVGAGTALLTGGATIAGGGGFGGSGGAKPSGTRFKPRVKPI